MNSIKNLYKRFYILSIIAGFLAMIGTVGCSEKDEVQSNIYGYVQFKLEKKETRATNTLDKLWDAKKIKITLQHEGSTITQTLVLNAYNSENAEFGVLSDKLKLMAGEYKIAGYFIYNNLDQEIMSGTISDNTFNITAGGLTVKPVSVSAKGHGMATFKLKKQMVTRATDENYPFSRKRVLDIVVKHKFTQQTINLEKINVSHVSGFENGIETSYALCDSLFWLEAGDYQISHYTTYSDKKGKNMLETQLFEGDNIPTFTIQDNSISKEIAVPILLDETAEYIKDYLALKEIWDLMDGPNWSYYGEAELNGCNWFFDKDIDLWGDQPGVSTDENGRVTTLSLIGFGAKGDLPDAIGQLTELQALYLGAHDELIGGRIAESLKADLSSQELQNIRLDYDTRFRARDPRLGLSEILQESINRDPGQKPIGRIELKDVQIGNLTNNITGVSRAIMRLTNLCQFYIANAPVKTDEFLKDIKPESEFYVERDQLSWEKMERLTDIEIYNCPNLTSLPMEMLTELPALQMLNIACNKGISAEQLKSDWEAFIDGKSGEKIQVIYMAYNNLKESPDESYMKRMKSLGMLDLAYNELERIHPMGKEINIAKIYLDYNKLTEIPHDSEGYFCGYANVESFSCSNNRLTKFPDIFNAKSVDVMASIDFSYNLISEFENGKDHRGINSASVNLSNNRLETFPSVLFHKNSPMNTLMLSGNGMKEIPKDALEGKNSFMLTSLDLSYNKLTKLNDNFLATHIPYLYGIDLSYNCFKDFPYEPLNISSLTTFGIRHQRDAEGNRILRTWPTGLYTCPSLTAFYIGGNDLRLIEDQISPYIRLFEIKDNPNITITLSSTVCDYIYAGYYTLIYDRTQDIRGCSYLDLD